MGFEPSITGWHKQTNPLSYESPSYFNCYETNLPTTNSNLGPRISKQSQQMQKMAPDSYNLTSLQ